MKHERGSMLPFLRQLFLATLVSCGLFPGTVSAEQGADSGPALLAKLEATPSEADVLEAVKRLSYGQTDGLDARFVSDLRTLLKNAGTAASVLKGLGVYAAPEFDLDLALRLPSPTQPVPADFTTLLSAIGTSGAVACRSALSALGHADNNTFFGDKGTRLAIWKALATIDSDAAITDVLAFYAAPSNHQVSQEASDFVTSLLRSSATKIVDHANDIRFFLGSGPGGVFGMAAPPIASGGNGSPRYQIQRELEQILVQRDTPASLGLLLIFTGSDAPDLAQAATAADYTPLQSASWLIPYDAFPFQVAPVDHPKAWNRLKSYAIGLPDDLIALSPPKVFALSRYETAAQANGAPKLGHTNLPSTSDILKAQYQFASALLDVVRKDYGVTTPSLPAFNPAAPPPAIGGPAAGPKPFQYALLDFGQGTVESILSQGLKSAGIDAAKIPQTAHFIVGTELSRLALVLYSVHSAAAIQGAAHEKVDLTAIEALIDQESTSINSDRIINTTLVAHLDKPADQTNQLSTFSNCKDGKITLASRQLSLGQYLYQETLKISCSGRPDATFNWIGDIPLSLIVPLKLHPRLLDFPNVSLAARELFSHAGIGGGIEDIDYIQAAPEVAMPYLLAAVLHPEVPWRSVHDVMVEEIGPLLGRAFFSDALPPVFGPPIPAIQGYPDFATSGIIITPLYAAAKAATQTRTSAWIAARETIDANQAIQNWGNSNLPGTVCRSYNACSFDPQTGMHCYPGTQCSGNPQRGQLNNITNGQINQAQPVIGKTTAWTLDGVSTSNVAGVDPLRTYMDDAFTDYTGVYHVRLTNGTDKYVTVTVPMADYPVWARAVLLDDPAFFDRVRADLAGGNSGASVQFQTAALTALARGRRVAIYQLRNADLLPIASQVSGNAIAPKPFLATPIGQIAATEVAALAEIYQKIVPPPQALGSPSPQFVSGLIQGWGVLRGQMQSNVNSEVTRVTNQIRSQMPSGWSIGIFYGSSGLGSGLGINFSAGQWSFSLSNIGPTGLAAVGFSGINIPIAAITLNPSAIPMPSTQPGAAPPISPPPPILQ
jgi:hypothetical protein